MLSSFTPNCQVTNIVMNVGSRNQCHCHYGQNQNCLKVSRIVLNCPKQLNLFFSFSKMSKIVKHIIFQNCQIIQNGQTCKKLSNCQKLSILSKITKSCQTKLFKFSKKLTIFLNCQILFKKTNFLKKKFSILSKIVKKNYK